MRDKGGNDGAERVAESSHSDEGTHVFAGIISGKSYDKPEGLRVEKA